MRRVTPRGLAATLYRRPSIIAGVTVVLVGVPTPAVLEPLAPADAGAAVLTVIVVVRLIRGARVPPAPVWGLLAAVAVAVAIATLASTDPATSAMGFIRHLELFVLVPAAVAVAIQDRRDALIVCGAVLLLALAQGALGTFQYATGTGASYGASDIRAVGTFGARQVIAMATVVGYGIVAALGLALVLPRRRLRWALIAAAGFLTIPLLASLSRGALVATVVAAAVVLLLAKPRQAVGIGVAAAAATAALLSAPGPTEIAQRVESITMVVSNPDQSVGDRYDLWRTAVSMWQAEPVTGVGPRMFPSHRDSHAPVSLSSGSDTADGHNGFHREELRSPHNMYLLVLSEQGVLGFLAFGGLLLAVATRTLRRATVIPHDPAATTLQLVAAGAVVWTMVDFLYGDIGGPVSVAGAVLLGVAVRVAQTPPPGAGRPAGGAGRARTGVPTRG